MLMYVIKYLASGSSSGGGGLSGVVKEPVRRVEESCSVQAWMWDFVFVVSAACRGVIEGVGMGGVVWLWGLSMVGGVIVIAHGPEARGESSKIFLSHPTCAVLLQHSTPRLQNHLHKSPKFSL